VGFLGCSGRERKCCFYSGRRVVIDYRVCVIDYDVKNNIPGASDSVVIDYRVSVIDYEGKNEVLVARVRVVIDYRVYVIDYQSRNNFANSPVNRLKVCCNRLRRYYLCSRLSCYFSNRLHCTNLGLCNRLRSY